MLPVRRNNNNFCSVICCSVLWFLTYGHVDENLRTEIVNSRRNCKWFKLLSDELISFRYSSLYFFNLRRNLNFTSLPFIEVLEICSWEIFWHIAISLGEMIRCPQKSASTAGLRIWSSISCSFLRCSNFHQE